ncbi:MAG: hypothetical protein IPG76_00395 [Acidobacteria bacterium]|nr:hypothetical protein [Acidobacteriota bacterium]
MPVTNIRLFGNLSVQRDQRKAIDFTNGKMQELFSYLLLHRNTRHHRESLATLLWGEYSTSQAKKCLRQTLWQLQAALNNCQDEEEHAFNN